MMSYSIFTFYFWKSKMWRLQFGLRLRYLSILLILVPNMKLQFLLYSTLWSVRLSSGLSESEPMKALGCPFRLAWKPDAISDGWFLFLLRSVASVLVECEGQQQQQIIVLCMPPAPHRLRPPCCTHHRHPALGGGLGKRAEGVAPLEIGCLGL